MDKLTTALVTLLLLGAIFSVTSRTTYAKNDISGVPSEDQIRASLNSGKKVILLLCPDNNACDYVAPPLEELSEEKDMGIVLYQTEASAFCARYPAKCPAQAPAVIIYKADSGIILYGDMPKEWLREYLLGYRPAK